jgi:hypothetical protein
MQVTLISLNPPKVLERNPYGENEPFYVPNTLSAHHQLKKDIDNWREAESSLKEWELSESDHYKPLYLYLKANKGNHVLTEEYVNKCLIGMELTVEIKDNKAWIV